MPVLTTDDAEIYYETAGDGPPLLLVAGGEDILVPPAAVETTRALLPDARMTTLPGAGHSLHWDAPEAFAQTAADFLHGG